MREEYVGRISRELIIAINQAPKHEPKDLYIEDALESIFGSYDWSRSFHTRQILMYDEVLLSEILIVIHKWLRRKCADIENICLVTTHHIGINTWWSKWCDVNHEKSFSIREILFSNSPQWRKWFFGSISSLPSKDFYIKNKNISRLFSFYGGSYPTNDRIYLILKMLEFSKIAEIEYIGKFNPKQQILDHAENLVYYKNQEEIDYLSGIYDEYVNDIGELNLTSMFLSEQILCEKIKFNGRQWEVDRHCWASVVRETSNSDYYCCLTEKTLRSFLHHLVVIPVGFRSVRELEKIGFWFPHDMFDYSYQDQKIYSERVGGLINSLRKLSTTYSLAQLQDFYLDNLHNFQHNAELVYKYINIRETYQ